ncbi:VOC family protein [Faunimonas sp. B44]|uniref:VOC family protein n=1 Tax=Faunimonas sp. B44 TaxID=3461493 RepID=UPI0040451740
MLAIDHILWAVPDLEEGIETLEKISGVRAVVGGRHPGRGTRNALASLGEDAYLEVISVDPDQSLENNLGATINAMQHAGLFTFAVQCPNLEELGNAATAGGLPFRGPEDWSRKQPDGHELHWRLAFTEGTKFGHLLPFYIDWLNSRHPSRTAARGLSLLEFEVAHPEREELASIYKHLGIDVLVRRSDRPSIRALLRGPAGEFVLNS